MQDADIPAKFPVPFANSAGGAYIEPIPLSPPATTGKASLQLGFPPETFQPIASGGAGPFGADFNGLLNQITAWNQWQAAGAPTFYDGAFVSAIGGYPKGAVLMSSTTVGLMFMSTIDANSTNPESGGSNWLTFQMGAQVPTGTILQFGGLVAPTSFVLCRFQELSRTTYANLFGVIGTAYGPGNGTTTFNAPPGDGAFFRGWDSTGTIDPGRVFGSLQQSSIKSHQHNTGNGYTLGSTVPGIYGTTTNDIGSSPHQTVHTDNNSPVVQTLTSNTGGGDTYPLNFTGNYIIKT